LSVAVETNTLWELRKLAAEIAKDKSVVTADFMNEVERYFREAIDYVWELNPSDAPDRLISFLREIDLLGWFYEYLRSVERTLPPTVRNRGPVRWVI